MKIVSENIVIESLLYLTILVSIIFSCYNYFPINNNNIEHMKDKIDNKEGVKDEYEKDEDEEEEDERRRRR